MADIPVGTKVPAGSSELSGGRIVLYDAVSTPELGEGITWG